MTDILHHYASHYANLLGTLALQQLTAHADIISAILIGITVGAAIANIAVSAAAVSDHWRNRRTSPRILWERRKQRVSYPRAAMAIGASGTLSFIALTGLVAWQRALPIIDCIAPLNGVWC